ncbi:MAG: mucoidy inhibitor MuiA family protein [Desulfomonilia bacterium]
MNTLRHIVILCALVAASAGFSHGEVIKKAVLYDTMAYLTIERTISGTASIDAPADMMPDSLMAVPTGTAVIRSITVEPQRTLSGSAKELAERLAATKASLDLKRKELSMVDKQVAVIYEAALAGDSEHAFEREQVSEALNFIDRRVPGLNRQLVEISGHIERLEIEVKDLQSQLDRISKRQGYRIDISAEGMIEVSYAVRNASWKPLYLVRATPDTGELILDASAQISQSTGMDWDVETLAVSTGRPGFGIQSPEIGPWFIEPYVHRPRAAFKSTQGKMVLDEAAAPVRAEQEIEETSTSFLVGVARQVLLPGDGTSLTVDLGRNTQEADFYRISVPKYRENAFLRAEGILKGTAPLVPGTYSAYVDGVYTGKGSLRGIQAGETMEIDLGVDEGILVERELKEKFHDRTLIGKSRTRFTYEMTIKNTRKTSVHVKVKDHIPISRDESIKVEVLEVNPPVKPDDEGILAWDITLDPGQEKRVQLSFSITGAPD